jgi:hemerythrin-like metal-binding protein
MITRDTLVHYRTGIKSIDDDHISMFKLLNRAEGCSDVDARNTILGEYIIELSNHIREEEQIMADAEYPYLDYHIINHGIIIRDTEELMKSYYVSKFAIDDNARKCLTHFEWFDIPFCKWMKEQQKIDKRQ